MPAYTHSDRGAAFMSNELTMFLRQRGIAGSRTSVYNAPGNGQCERYNGIIWTVIKLAIKSRKLDIAQWECVLPDALHSIRSLLCTAINATPHERLFHFTRRSTFGVLILTWLSAPGPVFLKRHLCSSKYDPIVDEVELVHATPNYAQIRFPSSRESTVPLRDIAPVGEFEPGSPEQNEANAEAGNEAAQAVHNPVDFVSGHGEHVENAASDPASSPSTSRCDDRAILQGGGNRAEEGLCADAE